ncbi:erythromycin esterase family protein [Flavobacterium granuli]|uniref:Erythromycin esterase homolog n=1 Tax=Flavobacterium granuli TaxID=280093 RepID=A0A1M5SLV2_9FLAO|nr:erythromycin esterase family protein [Flavobacterium granuli]PRZ21035.1 erythromycin esterase-like protein [Flavobacterium granuli]SHH39494.1 Erythromycin esterase homolog [Flavobacterium granuli]
MRTIQNSNDPIRSNEIIALLNSTATPLESSNDLDPLLEYIGEAKYVLLGEASHGTHEYYTWRAKITQRLIKEKGFSFVGVEGDWPDCYRLNRYAKGYLDPGKDIFSVMDEFKRWPTWMWANWETAAFIDWLKTHNENIAADKRIGFYGLDLYSFRESMNSIIQYLEKNDPKALKIAKEALSCYEPYSKDEGQSYARASAFVPELCENEIINMLTAIRKNAVNYNSDHENAMSTEQNAFVARNAEKYFRAMIRRGSASWNIRDEHMVSTVERLLKFHGTDAKVIVWEHNTHIGDARATDMAAEGMVNVGQLLREQYSTDGVVAVGFGSYKGSVIAGREWGDSMRKINVPEAEQESWEDLFHLASNGQNKLLLMNTLREEKCLSDFIGHRAIGVVYNPEHERFGNYVPSILPKRYDAFVYLDETTALHPIHIQPQGNQIPETYPFGM